jgi:cullin 1
VKLTSEILYLISKERNGESIEEDLVRNGIESFMALNIIDHNVPVEENPDYYQEEFEAPFLRATTDYNKQELDLVFQTENFVPDYLNKLEERLLDEERRAKRYLPQKTRDKAIRTVLIRGHCETLAQRLFEKGDNEKLHRMYMLLSRITPDGLEPLKKSFEAQVTTESVARPLVDSWIMSESDYASSLSGIREGQLRIVNECFEGDTHFLALLKKNDADISGSGKKKAKGKGRKKSSSWQFQEDVLWG